MAMLFLAACSTPARRAEERSAAFSKLPPRDQKLVLHGRLRTGLSQDAVYIAWGAPSRHDENGRAKQAVETWIYERQLSTYSPMGSFDQVNRRLSFSGPRFAFGLRPGFGYGGGFPDTGFLSSPRVTPTDWRIKRANFIDGRLSSFEVRWDEAAPEDLRAKF